MQTPPPLRNAPAQQRSHQRLERVLDAAESVLARHGAAAFTTTRVASVAQLPIGSVYRFFPNKEAIAEALAVRYWSDFADRVARVAGTDAAAPLEDPVGAVLDALASGFRTNPGFLALWYGGLRTERIRDATRPARDVIATSIERILARHWPSVSPRDRETVAAMVVLAGDGLLREAFRTDRRGQARVLEESRLMLASYIATRLGGGA